jgi:uncharacterized protein YbjT (DUF2867 family)
MNTPSSTPRPFSSPGTVLVTGGTGKTGRRVAERLTALGVDVRIGSRSAETGFDWTDPATWDAALAGVGAVYLAYSPDLAVPGADTVVGAFAEKAVAAGARRIVVLSGRGEAEAEAAEKAVRASGAEVTVVRSAFFAQNFFEGFFLEPLLAGELALPAGEVAEPFVDVDDIADVAVAALTEEGHAGEVYELSGPRALSFAEAVAVIGEATGRELRYIPLTLEEFGAALRGDGVPEEAVALMLYLFSEVLDGRNSAPADGVRRALGREARDFTDVVREAAAQGAWTR